MKSVLLTRAKEDNKRIIDELDDSNNFRFVELELLTRKPRSFTSSIVNNYSEIVISSNYAAQIIDADLCKGKNFWVIGKNSAAIIENKGANSVNYFKNVKDLIESLPNNLFSSTIYLSGNIITTHLSAKIRREIIYDVNYLEKLNKKIKAELIGNIDYILVYSENCAKTLLNLLIQSNLVKFLVNAKIIVISLKVRQVLQNYFKDIIVKPPEEIINYLKKLS